MVKMPHIEKSTGLERHICTPPIYKHTPRGQFMNFLQFCMNPHLEAQGFLQSLSEDPSEILSEGLLQ